MAGRPGGGSCYKLQEQQLSWEASKLWCLAEDAHLFTADTQAEITNVSHAWSKSHDYMIKSSEHSDSNTIRGELALSSGLCIHCAHLDRC